METTLREIKGNNAKKRISGALGAVKKWVKRNRIYLIAFALPVVIMYAAYVIFGIYPFGDRSVLAFDLNGQYAYFFEAFRNAVWSGDKSILYSWSRNLSGGFAGIYGYYLASPFTLIIVLLPKAMFLGSLLIMLLSKLGAAGVTFCYYLRKSKGLSEIHSLIFSVLYALCAYGVIQLMNPMWLDGLVFLPLIVLGIEYLVDRGKKLNFIIPLALMLISNFYIGYMICIFCALYFIAYVLLIGKKKSPKEMLCSLAEMAVSSMAAIMCAAVMILPIYNALKLGKFDFSEPDFSYRAQFKFGDFFAQFLTGQYEAITPDAHPEIYCGIFAAVLVPLFFLNRRIKNRKKIGYAALSVILTASMYIRPIDMVWHGFQMPVWIPYRYAFLLTFLLLSMAAETIANLKGIRPISIGVTFSVILMFLLVLLSRIKENDIVELMSKNIPDITKRDVYISLALAAVYCAAILVLRLVIKKGGGRRVTAVMTAAVITISCGELLYNALDTVKGVHEDAAIICADRSNWYDFMDSTSQVVDVLYDYDDSFYRCEKTFHRMANDNAALGIRGVSHFSSVMNAKTLKFLRAMGYAANTYYSRYDGSSMLTDSVLGIKYTMDKNLKKDYGTERYKKLSNPEYQPVFTYSYADKNDEYMIDIYENPNALSVGFMADKAVLDIEEFGEDVFHNQDLLLGGISGDLNSEYFKKIAVDPDTFVLNNVNASLNTGHTMYAAGEGDPTVDMFITVPSKNPIYLFFESDFSRMVNLWVSDEKDENGNYINYRYVNNYFGAYTQCAMRLGEFEPGKVIDLRMTITDEYTMIKNFYFYEFDEELFEKSINSIKQGQWDVTKAGGRSLEGKITAGEDKLMLTSIPYEPGWTVKVDGKKTDYIEVAQALIGIELAPGEHTVKMSYTPPGLVMGIFISLVGAAFTALIFIYDKKRIRQTKK